ncbi:hypothetical protein DMC30DRAFT_438443 [Rhodotorula diobovata]|uniref:Uncharacterized protein n=1 Tax=Rhodotorula diobovata TaxID=5288 RepID=A0A5C5G674_9BASI|nr:hypothetical protein DMC30DRAFT_438443 [Rhodotorula diobovata]
MRYLTAAAALATLASLVVALPATVCASRQYLDAASGVCKTCPSSTLTCTSATTALTCQRGSYLTADKRCVTGNRCPTNTFADSSKQACTKCYVKDAATCKDATAFGTLSCLTGCLNGPTKTCLPIGRLPSGSYCPNHVVTSCPGTGVKACDAAGKATTCKADYHLTDDAHIGDEGFYPTLGGCVLLCPAGAFVTVPSHTCKVCNDEGALACDASGVSDSCLDGYNLDSANVCIKCRNNEALDAETKSCRLDCPPAENYIVGYTIGALQHPIGAILRAHYQPIGVGQCVPCPGSSMYSCDKRGAATSCFNSYLVDGVCSGSCPDEATPTRIPAPDGFNYLPSDTVNQRIAYFGVCI